MDIMSDVETACRLREIKNDVDAIYEGNHQLLSYESCYRHVYCACVYGGSETCRALGSLLIRRIQKHVKTIENIDKWQIMTLMVRDIALFYDTQIVPALKSCAMRELSDALRSSENRHDPSLPGIPKSPLFAVAKAAWLVKVAERVQSSMKHARLGECFFSWYWRYARRAYAPGGRGRKRDLDAFVASRWA